MEGLATGVDGPSQGTRGAWFVVPFKYDPKDLKLRWISKQTVIDSSAERERELNLSSGRRLNHVYPHSHCAVSLCITKADEFLYSKV